MEIPELTLQEDIWGAILLDAWAGKEVTYLIRRDDGYLDPQPTISRTDLTAEIPAGDAEALGRARGRVLDMGCGWGRHVLWLQQRGLDVVGIDRSPGAVEVARLSGCRDVRVMAIDDAGFPPASFDTLVFMGGTIGIGCDIPGLARRLQRLHPIVPPGGCLIAHIREPEATDEPEHRAYHEQRKREGRYPGELRIRLEYEGCTEPWFDFTLVNAESLAETGQQTGWSVAEILGGPSSGYAVLDRL